MKKSLIVLLFTTVLIILWSCNSKQDNRSALAETKEKKLGKEAFAPAKNLSEYKKSIFLPTLENKLSPNKNSIYCATLLYAWDELRKEIKPPFQIDKELKDLTLLNNSQSFVDALNKGDYKSNTIVKGNNIKVNVEFSKSLPFEIKVEDLYNTLIFKNEKVYCFGIYGSDSCQSKIVEILYYKNDNEFLISLIPKDHAHEIILLKTNDRFNSMAKILSKIENYINLGNYEVRTRKAEWKYTFNEDDNIIIPKIKFNIETNYPTLEGKLFKSNQQSYLIKEAMQRTAFTLDEYGAQIESESEITTLSAMEEEKEKPQPKHLIFNKPFFIMLKKTHSKNPYFAMWVANSELMIK
ncbi:hypothetical protein [uncultured Bacteroides sp.]|uniref:hypothetical protein n=1 Tax=uncultured Bacteroides sp. TaxID=162156 RepID=UPI002AA62CD0|nr:hypothetical protein [uncultured Bacteroides sp.]